MSISLMVTFGRRAHTYLTCCFIQSTYKMAVNSRGTLSYSRLDPLSGLLKCFVVRRKIGDNVGGLQPSSVSS